MQNLIEKILVRLLFTSCISWEVYVWQWIEPFESRKMISRSEIRDHRLHQQKTVRIQNQVVLMAPGIPFCLPSQLWCYKCKQFGRSGQETFNGSRLQVSNVGGEGSPLISSWNFSAVNLEWKPWHLVNLSLSSSNSMRTPCVWSSHTRETLGSSHARSNQWARCNPFALECNLSTSRPRMITPKGNCFSPQRWAAVALGYPPYQKIVSMKCRQEGV